MPGPPASLERSHDAASAPNPRHGERTTHRRPDSAHPRDRTRQEQRIPRDGINRQLQPGLEREMAIEMIEEFSMGTQIKVIGVAAAAATPSST